MKSGGSPAGVKDHPCVGDMPLFIWNSLADVGGSLSKVALKKTRLLSPWTERGGICESLPKKSRSVATPPLILRRFLTTAGGFLIVVSLLALLPSLFYSILIRRTENPTGPLLPRRTQIISAQQLGDQFPQLRRSSSIGGALTHNYSLHNNNPNNLPIKLFLSRFAATYTFSSQHHYSLFGRKRCPSSLIAPFNCDCPILTIIL